MTSPTPPSRDAGPRAAGFIIVLGIFVGMFAGVAAGQPTAGVLAGLGVGVLVAVLLWLYDRRREQHGSGL